MAGVEEYIKRIEGLTKELPEKIKEAAEESLPEIEKRVRAYLPTEDKKQSDKVAKTIKSGVEESNGIITLEVTAGSAEAPAVRLHEEPIDGQRTPDDPPDPPPIERIKKGPKFLSQALRDAHPEIKKSVQATLSKIFRGQGSSPDLLNRYKREP